jgi:hypothetical protein
MVYPPSILTFNYKLSSVQIVIQVSGSNLFSKQKEEHIFGEEDVFFFWLTTIQDVITVVKTDLLYRSVPEV